MKSLFLFLTHGINYQDPYKLAPIRNVMQKKKKAHFEKKTNKNKQTNKKLHKYRLRRENLHILNRKKKKKKSLSYIGHKVCFFTIL